MARALDAADHRTSVLEAEAAALRKALNDCQSRHAEQMARWGRHTVIFSVKYA